MLLFNEAISALGLVELPLKGQRYTWTNKQHPPLLERLDWFFTSSSWTTCYPNTVVTALAMETLDHVPCLVIVSTDIPKGNILRFENFWLQREDFIAQVQSGWVLPYHVDDPAKIITAKFKNLRKTLKQWKQTLSALKECIHHTKLILSFMNILEEFRDPSLMNGISEGFCKKN